MRTAAELRAEADHLRTFPLNVMSFRTISDRATNRWSLPEPTGDFATDHAAGCRLAAEVVGAAQKTVAMGQVNTADNLMLLILDRLTDHIMRQAFMTVIATAMVSGMPAEELLPTMEAQWNRVFARNDTLFRTH
jgi:hypothetical protein